MRLCALLGLGCALGASGETALAQPANDTCSQTLTGFAIPPAGGTVAGTLALATRDALGTSCPGNQTGADVYHSITPAITGIYTFETCGLATWDTVLSLHTGCPASTANQVPGACNDDYCGGGAMSQSRLGSILLMAGQQYILRVGAYSSAMAGGAYSVAVTFTPRAINDECGTANPVLPLEAPVASSNVGASTTITVNPYSLCGGYGGSGGGADVFFRLVPPTSGGYAIGTCGSAIDTVVSVHSACPVSEENMVGCNDDGPNGFCSSNALNSQVYVMLTAGEVYYVRVAGYRFPDATGVPRVGNLLVLAHRDPGAIVMGACCNAAGGCDLHAAQECVGMYRGDGTSCVPDPCEAPMGACCMGDGTCTTESIGTCAGVYQGDGTMCGMTLCPQPPGVCCMGAVCMIVLPGDCLPPGPNIGAAWLGGMPCNGATLTNAPCCRADFNKVGGITVQDIFDYLNAWFAGSPFTHLAGNGPLTIQDIFDFLSVWFAGGC